VVVIQPLAVYEVPERVSTVNPDGIEVIVLVTARKVLLELSGELSVAGPSVTGGDVQLPTEIPKNLMQGRQNFGRPGIGNAKQT
jgi:chorismate-pyruvate lyase